MSSETLSPQSFGATPLAHGGVRFRLYAPSAHTVELALAGMPPQSIARSDDNFFEAIVPEARPGTRYAFIVDGLRVPDPAARFAPEGPHGDSVVVDPASFAWPDDDWTGRPWHEHVFYEIHVGTFTPEGTYAAACAKLPELVDLGITAIELMPLAQAPGTRNWGYDGVLIYAPAHAYGTPDDLKAFVVASHAHGLAMYLDVVYNHFGPEANYLHAYAPEFYTTDHHTPWGAAIDIARADREHVRAFFIENALYWLEEFRFDGLRLDAVHAIYDGDERAFLREIAATVRARVARTVHLVVENDANESALLAAGFRAQWNDDAHHAAHVVATSEHDGYYADYADLPVGRLGRALTKGFGYQGEPSAFRNGLLRGDRSDTYPLASFVAFAQNHDQVGNRPLGERITALAPAAAVRAIAAVLMLAPSIPLLFMGEEWGASTPFLFFCDFEPELARAVREGRRREFGAFAAFAGPSDGDRIPDPSAPATFARSTLRWDERTRPEHAAWLAYYRGLLRIRAAEIAPRSRAVIGLDASYETFGATGLRALFRLDDAASLALDANLGPHAEPELADRTGARVIFATHDATDARGIAAPWSVRWSLA